MKRKCPLCGVEMSDETHYRLLAQGLRGKACLDKACVPFETWQQVGNAERDAPATAGG